jgi:hypothetical protein
LVAQLGVHVPLGQVVVPCAFVQALPQVPQLVVVLVLASQPVAGLLSQLPHPELHAPIAQAAGVPLQAAVAFA